MATLLPLLLAGLLACTTAETPAPVPATPVATELVFEWLDDEQQAQGQAFHRIGGRATAPRTAEASLRQVARDALVERARTLGFQRLDDLQIESGCDAAAPDASACTVKIMAIASH